MTNMTAEESEAHQEGLAAAPDFFKLLEDREDDEFFVDGFYNAIWRQLGGLDYRLCRLEDDPQRKTNPFTRGGGPWLQFERGWYNAFGYDEFGDPEVEKIWAKTLSPKAVALIKRGEL